MQPSSASVENVDGLRQFGQSRRTETDSTTNSYKITLAAAEVKSLPTLGPFASISCLIPRRVHGMPLLATLSEWSGLPPVGSRTCRARRACEHREQQRQSP
jgi:hypothetical protein